MTAKLLLADLQAALGDDAPAPLNSPRDLLPVADVPVRVSAVLGRTSLTVAQLLKLGEGSVLDLDRRVGEAIDIYVNDRLVARGEMVVVDARLGVTMTEIVQDPETGD
jgi:flagellar motor switch protein FliN/FliY